VSFGWTFVVWLAGATAVVLAVAYALDFTRRRHALERIGNPAQLQRMMATLSGWRRVLKVVLIVTATTLVVLAMARPQVEGESTWRKRGIDVVIAMDFSKSMLAKDVYPNRLERMRQEVEELLDKLDSDRVGVVTFAGAAAHFPLTHDHQAARNLFRGLMPFEMPPGSDLGEAILVARCIARPDLTSEPGCERVGGHGRGGEPLVADPDKGPKIKQAPRKEELADRARAIVLFTDGEDTENRARAEIQRAVKLGINVFVVGVGTTAGELVPELDRHGNRTGWKKNPDGSFVTTRLDAAGLKELATVAGGPEGHYFVLDPKTFQTDALVKQLKRLKKGDLDKRVVHNPKEIYQLPLFAALLLLLLEGCISERKRRVIYPEEHSNAQTKT
jgi:Ca-activated chloride channel family protein